MTIQKRLSSKRLTISLCSVLGAACTLPSQAQAESQYLPVTPASVFLVEQATAPETRYPLEVTLGNVGQAVDNIVPIGLEQTGSYLGQTLYDFADPEILFEAAHNAIHSWITPLETSGLPLHLGQAMGGLLLGAADTVDGVGSLIYQGPEGGHPLSAILGPASEGIAAVTGSLFQDNGLLRPLTGSLGNNNQPMNQSLPSTPSPVSGLLLPVTGLINGLTGAVPTADSGNTGILQPVTGLVGSLLNSAPALPADGVTASPPINVDSASTPHNNGLLAPVTGLVNGLLGAPPR